MDKLGIFPASKLLIALVKLTWVFPRLTGIFILGKNGFKLMPAVLTIPLKIPFSSWAVVFRDRLLTNNCISPSPRQVCKSVKVPLIREFILPAKLIFALPKLTGTVKFSTRGLRLIPLVLTVPVRKP